MCLFSFILWLGRKIDNADIDSSESPKLHPYILQTVPSPLPLCACRHSTPSLALTISRLTCVYDVHLSITASSWSWFRHSHLTFTHYFASFPPLIRASVTFPVLDNLGQYRHTDAGLEAIIEYANLRLGMVGKLSRVFVAGIGELEGRMYRIGLPEWEREWLWVAEKGNRLREVRLKVAGKGKERCVIESGDERTGSGCILPGGVVGV